MKRKPDSALLDDESALKRVRPTLLDSGESRVTAASFTSFPEAISRIVGDYSADRERKDVVAALVGVKPITLCLSQDIDSPLGTCWSLGFLPSEHEWSSWHVQADKQFLITDIGGCLYFLNQTNSNNCRLAVEVLVVKLKKLTKNLSRTLDDLWNTIGALQDHLNNIKHVVFSITEHSSCCFTLKNVLDIATGFSIHVDPQQVLSQIIDDLKTCWRIKERLTFVDLSVFYFTSNDKPASEKYLAKFVISLNDPLSQRLLNVAASRMISNKIMWVTSLESYDDFDYFDKVTARLCRFIFSSIGFSPINLSLVKPLCHVSSRLDTTNLPRIKDSRYRQLCAPAYSYQNNRFIERIDINSDDCIALKLPRPRKPLKNNTPLSALVELLTGIGNKLNLTQLNNGYFPHLAHLTVIGGEISGHLDSDRVPCLKTLKFELGDVLDRSVSINYPLLQERAQLLIHAGRPWQLVATKEPGGWSLASYDPPGLNPLNDEKEDLSHSLDSLPFVRELLLVMGKQSHANEWQAQLKGDPSLESAAGDHNDRLLVWAPQRVQKMTAFGMGLLIVELEFEEQMPEQTRILTSLECHYVDVALHGAAFPNLQLLELYDGLGTMSGDFPQLEALSFRNADLLSPWEVEAPLLRSFSCRDVPSGQHFSLDLQLLPRLSCLQIKPFEDDWSRSPLLFGGKHTQALSSVHQLWLGGGRANPDLCKAYMVSNMRHLELTVSALGLPLTWYTAMLPCETLTINVIAAKLERLQQQKIRNLVVLPPLPRVTKLTVTSQGCPVVLRAAMPKLVECTVPTPKWLAPNFKCPALKRIRFTDQLSESDKAKCLDPTTYEAMCARPREVIFVFDCQLHTMD